MRKKKKVSFALTKSQDAVEEDATEGCYWRRYMVSNDTPEERYV